MKIMVFTEGTITIHKTAIDLTREEQILHAKNKIVTPGYFFDFVPIKNAVDKLTKWKNQGAEICYLTSRKIAEEVNDIKRGLKRDGFPDGQLFFRQEKEEYKDVAERVIPDILIEDDYESHGGIDKMTITHVRPEIKAKIKSIIIKEFEGIDHLPDKISVLTQDKKMENHFMIKQNDRIFFGHTFVLLFFSAFVFVAGWHAALEAYVYQWNVCLTTLIILIITQLTYYIWLTKTKRISKKIAIVYLPISLLVFIGLVATIVGLVSL